MSDATNTDDTPAPTPPRPSGPAPMVRGPMSSAGMPVEKSKNFRGTLRRLTDLMVPERAVTATVITLAVVSMVLSVSGPKVLGHATDLIVQGVIARVRGTGGIDMSALHRILAFAVALYLGSSALAWLQSRLLAGVVQRTMYRLREQIEAKVHRVPLQWLDRQPRGDILSRVTNDMDNLAQSLQQSLSQLLTATLTILGVTTMMFVISWPLALVALATIPLSMLIVKVVTARSKPRFVEQWRATGTLNSIVEESFTGHSLVKVYGRQDEVERRFAETNDEMFASSFQAQFIVGAIQPTMMFLGNLNYVAIAVIGGLRVASGSMTIGDIQAFIQYSRQFTQPLTQIASMLNVLQSGIASAERIFELLDAEEQTTETEFTFAEEPVGEVRFEHVSFSYQPDKPLIDDLSLIAHPGQTVAIVGPTGAGKTTLVNLIERFYELDAGRITLDGVDIATMPRRELRSRMGMVLQDTWLFSGTIRENILFGNEHATDEEFLAATRATYVDRFVRALPQGYNTHIDDEGGTVSAGEKQLITIARAFLADPTILILDEATSSVDTRTELLIQQAMAALRSQRTSFVIAHRLSTIRDADLILVMRDGRIVEQGNHRELLAARGAYYELYNAQFAAAAIDDL